MPGMTTAVRRYREDKVFREQQLKAKYDKYWADEIKDMPPCTYCYSTGHGVNACPDKDEDKAEQLMSDIAEPDMSSVKQFRDKLLPRSEDMMPSHPAEEDAGTRAMLAAGCFDPRKGGRDGLPVEEVDWENMYEALLIEHNNLKKLVEDKHWLKLQVYLYDANLCCISAHVQNPNGRMEQHYGGVIDKIEEKIRIIAKDILNK